jgi:hypothetical protein
LPPTIKNLTIAKIYTNTYLFVRYAPRICADFSGLE